MKKDRTRDVIDGALQAQVISHLALTVGTMYGVNKAAFGMLVSNGTAIETAAIIAVLAAVPAGIAVDGSLKKWLPYVIAWMTGKKDVDTGVERKGWLNWIIMFLCVAQLGVSTFLNFSVSPEIVEDAAGEIDTEKYDRMADRATTRYEKDLGRIEQGISQAQSEVSKAEQSKAALIAAAKQSKGAQMAKLAASGNGWAKSQTAAAERSAGRKGDRLIAAATAKLEKEQSRLSDYMDKSGSTLDSVTVATTGLTVATTTKHEQKKGRWTAVMVWFMALMAFTFVLSTIVVVVLEEETGEDFDSLPTASNIIGGVFKKTSNAFTKMAVKIFGLDKITVAPTLAGVDYSVRISSTQSHTAQEDRTQHSNTERSTGTTQNTGKKSCSVSPKEVRETQNKTELPYTEPNTERVLYSDNGRGKEWPTPDNVEEWKKLVKKARLWPIQADEAQSEETRKRNREKWELFVRYAKRFGYRAGIGETGKPFVNNHPEPIWSDDDHQVVWNIGEGGDFDQPNTDN
jgi:hypothetical protein